jgi:general secretion pathway protein E
MNAPLTGGAVLQSAIDYSRWSFVQAQRWRVVLARDVRAAAVAESVMDAWLALADRECDLLLLQRLESDLQASVCWQRIESSELDALLAAGAQQYRAMAGLQAGMFEDVSQAPLHELSAQRLAEESNPVIRMLDSLLFDGLQEGASDIHMECTAVGMNIRNRIDGVMLALQSIPDTNIAEQLISRLKVMAELDIGERRLPQDGRFKLRVQGRNIDFRLSIMPSVFGEDAVIRVLDRAQIDQAQGSLTLESLGFDGPTRAAVRRLAALPHGMLLMTGPTGSGKTTTLYAAISESNTGRDKIITIEDPVEYQLQGVVQIPVNEKKGLTFARGLRSILRHDPDRVMVGEIRDTETAQIAVQAALTGHLVFSTVHANNAFDVIGRFTHMGLDLYDVASALNGVVAQRLMRLNCSHCAQPMPLHAATDDAALLREMQAESGQQAVRYSQGVGCSHCRGTGYKGRHAVAELLLMDDELRDLIVTRAPITRLKAEAQRRGLRSLRQVAMALVLTGRSSMEELNRVSLAP